MIIQNRVLWGAFLAWALVSAIADREKHEVEYRDGRVQKAPSQYLAPNGRELTVLESE